MVMNLFWNCMLMLLHSRSSTFTMSKLDTHIPIFTGANWASWWLAMSAFNQASGHTWVLLVQKPSALGTTANAEEINFWIRWSMVNDSIIGSIKIQLLEATRAKFSTYEVAVTHSIQRRLDTRLSYMGSTHKETNFCEA